MLNIRNLNLISIQYWTYLSFTVPTLQYLNWVRILKGICNLKYPFQPYLRKPNVLNFFGKSIVETVKNLFCIL